MSLFYDMDIMSFSLYLLIAVSLILYYLIPMCHRWIVLFLMTVMFLFSANSLQNFIVSLGIAVATYGCGIIIKNNKNNTIISKLVMTVYVIIIVCTLFLYKEQAFFVNTFNIIATGSLSKQIIHVIPIVAPLGISYYFLTNISYICEVYWGTIEAEKNPLKFITYSLFFPTLSSGPITKYKESASKILNGHSFEYKSFCYGIQRIIWGFFKKLVVSERLAVIVNTIYANYSEYNGLYIVFAAGCFAMQLYTDFSGCIDMMLGVSELYGVELPENFNLPFSSLTLTEFWRRWHITLGGWLKEYVLYPVLKSPLMQYIGNACKKAFGKKTGKKIQTWLGLLVSWFLIGFWHGGGYNYIFGVGIFMGLVIIFGEMFENVFNKFKTFLKIDDKCMSYRLFQRTRTFLIFSFGLSFFRSPSLTEGFRMWKCCFETFNPWIFFDGSLYNLGLSQKECSLVIMSILLFLVTGIIKMITQTGIRELISRQNLVFRWIIYMILIFSVLIFGVYGYGFDAQSFIYQAF